jgi:hypothetical protein
MTPLPPAGWLPIYLRRNAATLTLDWAIFGDHRLVDPFFEQSVGTLLRHPARLLFRQTTAIEEVEALADAPPELAPAGFIFHISRCGSTLFAQALAADARHSVLSEAPPIDQLLALDAADPGLDFSRRVSRLQGLIHAYARRRRPEEARLFIKFDAWHTLHLPLIRAAFPHTPWVFLHRDPIEVLVSQHRQRGSQFIPGKMDPRPFGIRPGEIPVHDFDTYTARIIRAGCDAALDALALPGSPGYVIDYKQLSASLPGLIRDHFGVPDDEITRAALAAAIPRNAKNPGMKFIADSEAKHREAGEALRALAARWLDEPRNRLLRLAGPPRGTV